MENGHLRLRRCGIGQANARRDDVAHGAVIVGLKIFMVVVRERLHPPQPQGGKQNDRPDGSEGSKDVHVTHGERRYSNPHRRNKREFRPFPLGKALMAQHGKQQKKSNHENVPTGPSMINLAPVAAMTSSTQVQEATSSSLRP